MVAEDAAWTPSPWEPPTAATEAEHLLGALERQRATFRWKADGLDEAGLAVRVGASVMTLGGLLIHLAAVETLYSTWRLSGSAPLGPWDPGTWDTEEGWSATFDVGGRPATQVYEVYDAAVARSRKRIADALRRGSLDQPVEMSDPAGASASLRRLLFDLLEEYARHTGHADLLREAVDGRVGEDPPGDWLPPDPSDGPG
ncbi:MAG TPA: DUF664 domain-containing protein [Mycobacteriales bacterium]|nr:DUF664 domain-containing protein [Mycobacteriales bacterium]